MADIANIINVTLLPTGTVAARDNMNVVAIITSEQTFLSSAKRYEQFSDLASVGVAFGTTSATYAFAAKFFATTPNPVNAGGVLVVGFWRSATENVAATAGVLSGGEVNQANLIGQLQTIADGSFDIDIDAATQVITGLDFQSSTDIDDVLAVLNAAVTGAVVSFGLSGLVVTSDTTGVASVVELAVPAATPVGTDVSTILGLAAGTGAVVIGGADAAVLAAESMLESITELKAQVNIKGAMFIDQPAPSDATALAAWSKAESVLVYDVFSNAANLEISPTNTVWQIKLSGGTNYRMLYSKAANRQLAATYMARAHTVNFSAEKSALTMQLKELSVLPEVYTETEVKKAKAVGLDIYTTIKLTPVVLTSGANDFMDNRYNLIAFIDAVQTDLYNVIKATSTKIPQTQQGVDTLVDQGERTTRGFVKAGVFGAGTWTSPDFFGDIDAFNRNIEDNGFYWLGGSLADQLPADRAARKSPILRCAVKNTGAIHSADVIINFNP